MKYMRYLAGAICLAVLSTPLTLSRCHAQDTDAARPALDTDAPKADENTDEARPPVNEEDDEASDDLAVPLPTGSGAGAYDLNSLFSW